MKLRVAVALLFLGSLAALASAQVRAGGEFRVNTYTTAYQFDPAVASDGYGDFVVAWSVFGGTRPGVFAQRYDAAGMPLGGELQVTGTTYGMETSVAREPRGRFVVVWASPAADGDGFGVLGRRYDASGIPLGAEFQVNTHTTGSQRGPVVASDAAGNFVVAWVSDGQDGDDRGVVAQRFDASGGKRGAEFQVNTYTTRAQSSVSLASDSAGNFVVVWASETQGSGVWDLFGRRYNASGTAQGYEFQVNGWTGAYWPDVAVDPSGGFAVVWENYGHDGDGGGIFAQLVDAAGGTSGIEFQVNTYTTARQTTPTVATDAAGNFVVAWVSEIQDGDLGGIYAQRLSASGTRRGSEFRVNTYTPIFQDTPAVASDAAGNAFVVWESYFQDGSYEGIYAQRFGGLQPAALSLDPAPSAAGNGVLEVNETVNVLPSWKNVNGATQSFDGVATGFDGPAAAGVSYNLLDGDSLYGTVDDNVTQQCSDCYQVQVTSTATRPATHWDATLTELLTPDTLGQVKQWSLHIGDSFTDVPKTSAYYRFVETVLHKGITGGCTATTYCPGTSATRGQMAIFALVGKQGSSYSPPACGTTPMFTDVPVTSPFCKWVEEMARRGIAGGCGGGNYCPNTAVTRAQMPVFMLKTLDPAFTPPACGTPVFGDVPASSPYCRWIEELARHGVVAGCGGGNYCPNNPVNRAQMAVFISATFGLTLYGP